MSPEKLDFPQKRPFSWPEKNSHGFSLRRRGRETRAERESVSKLARASPSSSVRAAAERALNKLGMNSDHAAKLWKLPSASDAATRSYDDSGCHPPDPWAGDEGFSRGFQRCQQCAVSHCLPASCLVSPFQGFRSCDSWYPVRRCALPRADLSVPLRGENQNVVIPLDVGQLGANRGKQPGDVG